MLSFYVLVAEVSPKTESDFHEHERVAPCILRNLTNITPSTEQTRFWPFHLPGIFFAYIIIDFSGMASAAVHFLFDAIASLVALDESDGLLNLRAAFRSFEPQAEVKNAPILLTLAVCAKFSQVLVSTPILTHRTPTE
jgi:hypothetical protein